jgi:hypothetical protein
MLGCLLERLVRNGKETAVEDLVTETVDAV